MKENLANMESSTQYPQEIKETHHQSSHNNTGIGMQSLSSKTHHHHHLQENEFKNHEMGSNNKKIAKVEKPLMEDDSGRERLKRHRIEVAGSVWIPEIWGQEELLKDWIDCSAFEASLVPNRIMSARSALVEEGRRATTGRLRIENRC